MNNHNTHTIRNFASKKRIELSRNKDEMIIGVQVGSTVAWGEDPRNQDQRAFTSAVSATAFLRKVADADQRMIAQVEWKAPEGVDPSATVVPPDFRDVFARIEEVDGEPRIKVVQ